MNLEDAAKQLAELGHPTRLRAFRLLVEAGPEGLTVNEIQRELGTPASTLSHHIAHLVWAGIVVQARIGTTVRSRIDHVRVQDLLDFLVKDCCARLQKRPSRRTAPRRSAG